MRIIFVRHGEPDYARDCLTETGWAQARLAAERLAPERPEALYASPMGRALQTAEPTVQRTGAGPVRVLPFLHELCWGSIDGTPTFADGHPWTIADELIRLGWDLNDPAWPEHPFFQNNTVTASAAMVARETDAFLAGLGYAREGLYYRCLRPDDAEHTVAVFCHGGSSSAVLARLFNLTFPYVCAVFHLPFCGLAIARFDRRPGSLCVPHLERVE